MDRAIQDTYPDDLAWCYGCGRLNAQGLQIKSYWDGEETLAVFTPRPYHIAIPGYVYGGLIASLIDCHATGTAAAVMARGRGIPLGSDPALRFVTASLAVDYLKPTPLGVPLEVRARAVEITGRRVIVEVTVAAAGTITARGKVTSVQLPEEMRSRPPGQA